MKSKINNEFSFLGTGFAENDTLIAETNLKYDPIF